MEHTTPLKKCSEPDCERTFKDHRWGRIKAQGQGWFFKRAATYEDEDLAWCPDHVPGWVAEWRARRER